MVACATEVTAGRTTLFLHHFPALRTGLLSLSPRDEEDQPAWGAAIPIASLGNLSTNSLPMPKLSLMKPFGLAASQVDMLISWYSGELNRISTLVGWSPT